MKGAEKKLIIILLCIFGALQLSCWNWDNPLDPKVNQPPKQPRLPSPGNRSTIINRSWQSDEISIRLSWIGGDPDRDDAVSYDVYLPAPDNPAVIETTTDTFLVWTTALETRKYLWQVIARDELGVETQGDIWSFIIQHKPLDHQVNQPPKQPRLPFPGNGSTIIYRSWQSNEISIRLSWIGGDPDRDDAVSYDVYLPAPDNPAVIETTTDTCLVWTTALETREYLWQVIARDELGVETQGEIWSFIIQHKGWMDVFE